ncbi:hypothetical protein [Neisseria weixii]|uniref:hypothetical protein n=1 Tax=Neisseria weixii TaxID=1853276 RepID=UPI00359F449C
MTSLKTLAPAALLLALVTGCASTNKTENPQPTTAAVAPVPAQASAAQTEAPAEPQQPKTRTVTSIDGKKEVAYKCGDKGQNRLTVMYGLQGNDVVVAQVKYQDKLSPNLFLLEEGSDDRNAFTANGITWSAAKANAANVDKVDGNMLTQEGVTTVNGQQQQVTQIVTKYCKLDKAATAKLAKANKQQNAVKP